MPWVVRRPDADGKLRHAAFYRDPTGTTRSAGTFSSEREARAAGRRAESSVEAGSWFDRTAGKVSSATTSSRPGDPSITSFQ